MNKILIAAMLLCSISMAAKDKVDIKVTPITNDADAANNGVIYALPRTVVRVRVEAEIVQRKVGPFFRYSNKYLNLQNVITEDETIWHLKNISISTVSEANLQQRYKITATGGSMPAIQLTNNGILAGVNTIGTSNDAVESVNICSPIIDELSFDNIPLNSEILTKTSSAAMAEETAYTIYRLRQKRVSLLGGENAVVLADGQAYNTVLNELNEIEKQYVSLFSGIEKRQTVVRYFEFSPDQYTPTTNVLFRFSDKTGFVDKMDLNGTPVYADLTIHNDTRISEFAATSKQRKSQPLTGLRYINPGNITVKIIDRNIPMAEAKLKCAQTGQILTLPVEMLKDNQTIKFDTITGALEHVNNASSSK